MQMFVSCYTHAHLLLSMQKHSTSLSKGAIVGTLNATSIYVMQNKVSCKFLMILSEKIYHVDDHTFIIMIYTKTLSVTIILLTIGIILKRNFST